MRVPVPAEKIELPLLTIDIGMAKISRAILERVGNLRVLSFHQFRMSNSWMRGVRDSSRYCSSSDFVGWLVAISERYISKSTSPSPVEGAVA
ncbi:Os03g0733500 [Oryza sativa Japonica Group]|uniref:Os03g0733500 protein n=1 Tax=Oryza sativa subsp. japonica TaxID=39947 RepID=A0A0P0W3A2_ORYSJ|nr:hypothetical protein EE612_020268 [Oryza sativa]BAS86237.1 Os03g0733500 [Oryza sativa Japonica Group]